MSIFSKKSIVASIGTMLEYYDYSLFIIFFPLISSEFFPSNSLYASLSKSYLILMLAMLARPFGALFFGAIGDFYGRSTALLFSMYGIALATLAIGLAPSATMAGMISVIILLIAKTIQIFCFGGEYNGAGIYIVEHADEKNALLSGSLLSAFGLVGGLIASIMGIILTSQMFPAWSWRLGFIFGGVVGLICIYFRKNLLESPGFVCADSRKHRLINLFKLFPMEFLAGMLIGGASTVQITTVFIFINPILAAKGSFNNHQLMLLQFLLFSTTTIMLLLISIIVRKKSPEKVFIFACVITAMTVYPLLAVLDSFNLFWGILSLVLLSVINEISFSPSNACLKKLFPSQYRYRGASLSFCTGLALFGGLTPVIENYLYHLTGTFSVISAWIGLVYLMAFFVNYLTFKKQFREFKTAGILVSLASVQEIK